MAANTVGDTLKLSGMFGDLGMLFGFAFAWVAGLPATFFACNSVVFAMLPDGPHDGPLGRALG